MSIMMSREAEVGKRQLALFETRVRLKASLPRRPSGPSPKTSVSRARPQKGAIASAPPREQAL